MDEQDQCVEGVDLLQLVNGRDWMTILAALLKDDTPESQHITEILMNRTKHGRIVRILRMINEEQPTSRQMERTMCVTRRTIFRDLRELQDMGAAFEIVDRFNYKIEKLPPALKRFL